MVKPKFVNPEGVHRPQGYTHAVSIENPSKIVYISGQVAVNEKGDTVGKGDLETQARQVYKNLSTVLKSLGASFDNVVKQNIYTTRPDQISIIRKVRSEVIGSEHPPASTLIGVTALANPDFLIEVEMIAVLD